MGGTVRCPKCDKPAIIVKVRRWLRAVGQRKVERQVRVTLIVCPAPAGCGKRFLLPVVEIPLPPEETTLRYLAPDPRLSQRDSKR